METVLKFLTKVTWNNHDINRSLWLQIYSAGECVQNSLFTNELQELLAFTSYCGVLPTKVCALPVNRISIIHVDIVPGSHAKFHVSDNFVYINEVN